ncbi:MAG: nucleotidyltransferase domain-containing protein [bacterium]
MKAIDSKIIPQSVQQEIQQRIDSVEQEHNVKVIYAVESGSRAWGFASPNSDYDVRFIYLHKKDWYLEGKRDVIEYPIVDEIDLSGWDARKTLKLFHKSNPSFVEWLQSPIIYRDDGVFAHTAREILIDNYSINKGIYHYRSMAKSNYRGYLKKPLVPLKKYFYVLRPLLSIMWIEKHNNPAPIEFEKLTALVNTNADLDKAISKLIKTKKCSLEKEMVPAIPAIDEFITSELERLSHFTGIPENHFDYEPLNTLFQRILVHN